MGDHTQRNCSPGYKCVAAGPDYTPRCAPWGTSYTPCKLPANWCWDEVDFTANAEIDLPYWCEKGKVTGCTGKGTEYTDCN